MTNLLDLPRHSEVEGAAPEAVRRAVGSVLVIGPGSRGRGGIAAVIRMHQRTSTWERRRTRWLETYDDRSGLHKIVAALRSYLAAPCLIFRADLVHLHLAAQTSLLRKLPFLAVARLCGRPVVVHVHAPSVNSLFRDTPQWARHWVFQNASRVVALSGSWATTFAHYEPAARIVVMPNPVRMFDKARAKTGRGPVVLFVGKLDARKGYLDLLNAAAVTLNEFPEAQFWFAGHGELEAAQRRAEALGIAGSVRLLGWLEGAALEDIYSQAAVFVLPSYAEGMPMSVIEAMSHGIPVVCTPVGGLPELIRDGENGVFVSPGDITTLARRIGDLVGDPELATAMGAAGRAHVQRHCALGDVSKALDSLYAEVLHER